MHQVCLMTLGVGDRFRTAFCATTFSENLSAADRRDFRLCCKRWRKVGSEVTITIQLPHVDLWEDAAEEARKGCPASSIAVRVAGCQQFEGCAELLHKLLCDSVLYSLYQSSSRMFL